jgi:hypothetical protein
MFREVTMVEITEVLRLRLAGTRKKRIAAQLGLDPKTLRRYIPDRDPHRTAARRCVRPRPRRPTCRVGESPRSPAIAGWRRVSSRRPSTMGPSLSATSSIRSCPDCHQGHFNGCRSRSNWNRIGSTVARCGA